MPSPELSPLHPALQAGRILEAFAAGNEPLLQQELQKSQNLGRAPTPALEQEQLELLRALSQRMLRFGDPLSHDRRDPAVRCCLDLLAHLAQAPSLPPVAGKNPYQRSSQLM